MTNADSTPRNMHASNDRPNPATGPLHIALTFDCESDQFDRSVGDGAGDFRAQLTWRGIEEGLPRIREMLDRFADESGRRPPVTWFVRVDSQLQHVFGDAGYLLDRFRSTWTECAGRGDEIGFHPHLYRWSGTTWCQETDDDALASSLKHAVRAARRRLGQAPLSSRIGEAFCSNSILATLDELGVRCDSTAMPGRVRQDHDRWLDWGPTPDEPYHPSRMDYRQPGPDSLRLVEVPMSMIPVKAEYDAAPLRRYIDLSFHHAAVKDGLRAFVRTSRLLVGVNHPSTVLAHPAGRHHGLISNDLNVFRANLDLIVEECRNLQRPVRFITLADCLRLAPANETPTASTP